MWFKINANCHFKRVILHSAMFCLMENLCKSILCRLLHSAIERRFSPFPSGDDICRLLLTFTISLKTDQNVAPDQDLN